MAYRPHIEPEAVALLKRHEQWQLRDGDRLPEMLLPAQFMLEDLQEISSKGEKPPERPLVPFYEHSSCPRSLSVFSMGSSGI